MIQLMLDIKSIIFLIHSVLYCDALYENFFSSILRIVVNLCPICQKKAKVPRCLFYTLPKDF